MHTFSVLICGNIARQFFFNLKSNYGSEQVSVSQQYNFINKNYSAVLKAHI